MSRAVRVGERPSGLLSRFWDRVRGARPPTRVTPDVGDDSVTDLADLVREDLRLRYERGERPAVAEYLDRFPRLRDAHERVISLVYEEYCLREEQGEALDADSFCARYAPWRDSLVSQLRYHRDLSRAVSEPQPSPARFPKPGSRFLWFELDRELGRGYAGRVFLARDATLGDRRVALKLARDRSDEAVLLGRLDHPHIMPVTLIEHDPETDLRAMCMPYLAGWPLSEVIDRVHALGRPRRAAALQLALGRRDDDEPGEAPLDWPGFPRRGRFVDGAAWLGWKLADALAYAHGRGVSHRDIKPANVLVTHRYGPMLLDLNLAHAHCDGAAAASAATGGTLPYMAPEHLAAFLDPDRWSEVGPAADLYALGLVLRELLTGRRPEVPDSALPTTRKIAELHDRRQAGAPSPVRADNPDVPHALEAILARCLAPRPADRYASAAELAADLRHHLRREPLRTVRNPSRREAAANWAWRRRPHLAVAAGMLALGGGYALWLADAHRYAGKLLDLAADATIRGELDEARTRYDGVLEYRPDWYKALWGLGTLSLRQSDQKEKLAVSAKAQGAREKAAAFRQEARDKLVEGEGFFNRAIEAARSDPQADRAKRAALHLDRARARTRLGQEAGYRGGQAYDSPKQAHTPASRAAFLESAGYFQGALDDLVQAAELQAGAVDPVAELCWAFAYLGRGDAASAIDDYARSVPDFQKALEYAQKVSASKAPESVQNQAMKLIQTIKEHLAADEPKLATLPAGAGPAAR